MDKMNFTYSIATFPQITTIRLIENGSHDFLIMATVRICHCVHFQDFENSMKMWECKHTEIQAALQPQMDSEESQDILSDEEHAQIQHLAQLAENLISR